VLLLLLVSTIPDSAFSACTGETAEWRKMETGIVELLNVRQQKIKLIVKVADDPAERAAGFQYICPQQVNDNAILFIFSEPITARFHMYNVYAPLDIAFIGGDGVILDIETMRPASWEINGKSKLYGPSSAFLYALEIRSGFFSEQGITVGNSKLLNGDLVKPVDQEPVRE